jgi:hypothetical protein
VAGDVNDLDAIVKNKDISYKQAHQQLMMLFSKLSDPKGIKNVILHSAKSSGVFYSSRTKDEFERYDEAIFIGLCRLMHIGTNESIYHIVDLLQYDLGVSNNEVLRQRITEIGSPALQHLKTKLQELEDSKLSSDKRNRERVRANIQAIHECMSHIEQGTKIDAGVTPCQ